MELATTEMFCVLFTELLELMYQALLFRLYVVRAMYSWQKAFNNARCWKV
jgi:hypothetical protein